MVRASLKLGVLCASAAVTLACAGVGPAWSMTVQPVVLDLQTAGRGMSQPISVQNTFSTPLTVELRIDELGFDEDGVKPTGKDPGDLLVFPPQAIIQPGQSQSFRVQWVGDPALARSKHYYVTVAQLPVQMPQGQSGIQVLYNFQVMVSVAPQGARPELKVIASEIGRDQAGKPVPVITIHNDSAAHGYLSQGRLRLVERDGAGREVLDRTLSGPEIQQTMGWGLIAPGQTRRLQVPVELPSADGALEARFSAEARR